MLVCVQGERAFGLDCHPRWLVPVRDLLLFAVFASGFFGAAVSWKGHAYSVQADGTLIPDRRSPAS